MRILLVVLISGVISLVAQAQTGSREKTIFTVTGTFCANPWNGDEGPNFGAADRVADQIALKKCFPYQIHRETDYATDVYDGCKKGYWGSKSTASYSCSKEIVPEPNCQPQPIPQPTPTPVPPYCNSHADCHSAEWCKGGRCQPIGF